MKKTLIFFSILIILVTAGISFANLFPAPKKQLPRIDKTKIKIISEESAVISAVEKVGPSVVTINIAQDRNVIDFFEFDPFNPFDPQRAPQTKKEHIEQDIGTGFIVNKEGHIVTNKHVVGDRNAQYRIITKDDKTYNVEKIYRDPANDIAILKVNFGKDKIKPIELGDSSNLKVGQFVIAIGTALGEFRHTVTTGVVSGLGRGITAGDIYQGFVEQIDNVIQTDAAINPGNSGGPLLNSAGQVIGVNVAMVSGSENIGFAIPINIVKESLANFNRTGKFSRPFLGVRYKMIDKRLALLNEVPEGAYIQDIIKNSPADKTGIKEGDIITKVNGQKVTEDKGGLAKIISRKKVGDKLKLEIYRDDKKINLEVVLAETES